MNSLTRTAHGEASWRRHGRSLAWAPYQASTGSRYRFPMTSRSSHGPRGGSAEAVEDGRLGEAGQAFPGHPGVRRADAADLLDFLDTGGEQLLQAAEAGGDVLGGVPGQPGD